MLTEKELEFLSYWKANREREKKPWRQLQAGLPMGLSLAAAILVCTFSGWYKRAMMEISSDVSPWWLIFSIMVVALAGSYFYKNQQWDRNEQAYLELLSKQRKERLTVDEE